MKKEDLKNLFDILQEEGPHVRSALLVLTDGNGGMKMVQTGIDQDIFLMAKMSEHLSCLKMFGHIAMPTHAAPETKQ